MRSPLRPGPWRDVYERVLIYLTALGGFSVGLGILYLSPRGIDGTDAVAWLAIGIGATAVAALVLGQRRSVPFLFATVILVGIVAPFVDLAVAMALSTILVSVLATGALLLERSSSFWSLAALTMTALAVRPLLDLFDVGRLQTQAVPATVPWVLALVTLSLTGIGFRALRRQLMRREAHQQEMSSLISRLAFHIRTPLTPVIGFAHLLEAEVEDNEARDFAHRIVMRAWDVADTVDDLIIATRQDVNSLELLKRPIDLATMVDHCLRDVSGAREKLLYASVDGWVIGDPDRARHIIKHLLSNAVLHGGPAITIHTRIRGRNVELHISDNGMPLGESELERIFEPFYQRTVGDEPAGRGVGLSVSRVLAQAMGGDLRMVSNHTGNSAVLVLPADPTRSLAVAPETDIPPKGAVSKSPPRATPAA